ncbi:major facilitator superfamily transporter [Ceratobasidium sp. AG-Ba]|nr:major facilitator superfamily transporter [Ceratobasidium sp. AG-Ba]
MSPGSGQTAECLGSDVEAHSLLSSKPKFRWTFVIVLSALMIAVTATSELTWPFINQMIVDIGAAPNPQSVGFYSGLIETVASFFGFATIFPGSVVADWYGRKTVIYAALLGTAIGQAFFGLSNTLFGLIACRSIIYALGPQLAWSATVTVLGDLSDDGSHGAAISAVNASYRLGQGIFTKNQISANCNVLRILGQLISPIFSAALAHPASRYKWFNLPFWKDHPYALPCLAGSTLCLGGVYMIECCLVETAPVRNDTSGVECPKASYGSTNPTNNFETAPAAMAIAQDEAAPPQMLPATLEPVAHQAAYHPGVVWYSPRIIQLLLSSWIMYFITISFSALFPLWAFTPITNGGLGASENTIGIYISARAIIQFLLLGPFAYFENWFGATRLYAYSLSVYALSSALSFPLLNLMARSPDMNVFWINTALGAHFILSGLGNYCTSCMVMMMNQAAPSPQALSQLVGISQSVLGIGQCMAPIVTLSVFEFSIKSDVLNGNVVWVFLLVLSLAASIHSFTLKKPA